VFRHVSSSGSLKNFGSLLRVSTCVILREFEKFWFTPTCFDMCHPQGFQNFRFTPACFDMCHPQGVSKLLVPSCASRHVSSSGSFINFSDDRRTDITKLSCLFAILQTPPVVLHLQTTDRPDINAKRRLKQCDQLYTSQMTQPLFRDMAPRSLVLYRCFGLPCCLQLQGRKGRRQDLSKCP